MPGLTPGELFVQYVEAMVRRLWAEAVAREGDYLDDRIP